MIDAHTLNTLEFPKVISLIEGRCRTPFGVEEVRKIAPLFDKPEIDRRQIEVSQMKDIINFGQAFPLYRLEDCRELLSKSTVEGIFLDPKEILVINELVSVSIEINGYDKPGRANFPAIAGYIGKVRAFPELKKEIRRIIDEHGEIADNASPHLRQIRFEVGESRRNITALLERILAGRQKQSGWQDDLVTMRSGRYVIPIPSSRYQSDVGILHDRSQSGATLFVEPRESVELNNRINLLQQEERVEMDRILRALTKEIALRSEPLLENIRLIGTLDAIHACADFSNMCGGNRPIVDENALFDLRDLRHPLLVVQTGNAEKVVPNNIGLDQSRQAILVTGPNTGGKTILLKAIGLGVLMAQSGLHISANEKSVVGIFADIFADIGDEQSIELSLSTFSSHIRNIISGLNGAADNVLLLFDEIGAGTDPGEGGALAEAIILYTIERKAKLVASTHYSQLKTLAMEYPEIENASLEFDRRTLAPTFRLNLGIPGSSYAVEIAGRLGLPEEICRRASLLVGTGEKSLTTLISSLETELGAVKEDKARLSERLARAEELENFYQVETDKLKKDVEQLRKDRLAETEKFLSETRRDIERLVAEIRSSQASEKSVKEFHHHLQERQQQLKKVKREPRPKAIDHFVYKKGDAVRILTIEQEGEIESLIGKDKARVKIGNVTTTVALRELQKVSKDKPPKAARLAKKVTAEQLESPEIHLRGMTVEEALEAVEKFLDRAVLSGLGQVYVIHGKGTGILRRMLTNYLRSHPEVASIRLGNWNEGGAGVTIVKLKD